LKLWKLLITFCTEKTTHLHLIQVLVFSICYIGYILDLKESGLPKQF